MMTDQDYELLSAYIDGMLTTQERTQLEARLQNEPTLQRELNALRETIALVKSLPALKAPRDFTLTAEMVQPIKVVRFPMLSALSAVAAMILILAGVLLMVNDGTTVNITTSDEIALAATPTLAGTLIVAPPEVMSQMAAPETIDAPLPSSGGAAMLPPVTPLPTQLRTMTAELYESEAEAPPADDISSSGVMADEANDSVMAEMATLTDQATDESMTLDATEAIIEQPPAEPSARQAEREFEEQPSARNTVSTALIGAGVALLILAALTYLRSRTS